MASASSDPAAADAPARERAARLAAELERSERRREAAEQWAAFLEAELDDDRVTVDSRRNQIELEVPLDPGTDTWRHYLAVGLWDGDAGVQKVAVDAGETSPAAGRRAATRRRCSTSASGRRTRSRWSATST